LFSRRHPSGLSQGFFGKASLEITVPSVARN
jgi:hypothetical protein